jgi:hypothetical protein
MTFRCMQTSFERSWIKAASVADDVGGDAVFVVDADVHHRRQVSKRATAARIG